MNKGSITNGSTGMGCPGGASISSVEAVLKRYGIALQNAAGGFRSFADVLNELREKWGNSRQMISARLQVLLPSKCSKAGWWFLASTPFLQRRQKMRRNITPEEIGEMHDR